MSAMTETRYSFEHEGEVIWQCNARVAKIIMDGVQGHWMPYTSKLSQKMVTAYVMDEEMVFTPGGSAHEVHLLVHKNGYLYPDKKAEK